MNGRILNLIFFLLISCGTQQEYKPKCTSIESNKTKKFINQEEGFTIDIPVEMTVIPNKAYFKFNGIDTTNLQKENFMNSLSIEKYSLKEGQTFDEFYKDIEKRNEEAKLRIEPVNFEKLIETTISGKPSKISTVGIKSGNTVFMTKQYYIQEKKIIFVITVGTTNNNYEDVFCQYYPIVKSLNQLKN